MVNSKKINIGISIGDPNGIGIEIILKTLSDRNLYKECNFIVYSSEDLIKKQQDFFKIKTVPIKKIHSLKRFLSERVLRMISIPMPFGSPIEIPIFIFFEFTTS